VPVNKCLLHTSKGFPPSTGSNCDQERDGQTTSDCGHYGLHKNTADGLQFRILGKLTKRYKHKVT
jgi:hypothetical protein